MTLAPKRSNKGPPMTEELKMQKVWRDPIQEIAEMFSPRSWLWL